MQSEPSNSSANDQSQPKDLDHGRTLLSMRSGGNVQRPPLSPPCSLECRGDTYSTALHEMHAAEMLPFLPACSFTIANTSPPLTIPFGHGLSTAPCIAQGLELSTWEEIERWWLDTRQQVPCKSTWRKIKRRKDRLHGSSRYVVCSSW